MYAFFVLGLIPGTNFQITFQVWMDTLALSIAGLCLLYLRRQHRHHGYVMLPSLVIYFSVLSSLARFRVKRVTRQLLQA